ncbi:hypothetical protein N7501_008222 [Penicillium viridicatum]|nr:hypothetical protein N7501_008222 [Penicillium viridicatum]
METRNKIPSELLFRELFAGDANTAADPEAIRLIESTLKENPIMCHELQRSFRMALKLRQPCLADTSLAEFVARDHSSSLMDTPSSISSAVLKEMVIVAANIQRLACACLTTLLTRVRKVQPRCCRGIREPGLLEKQEGTGPYQPRDHLQLYSDLSIAGARLNWLQSDLEKWRTESTDWYSVPPMMREELRTISECLETLYEVYPILRTTKSQVTSTDDGIHLISQLPTASRLRCNFDFRAPPSPFAWGTELDYRVSVFMQAWMQMENQECEPRVAEERLIRE